MTIVSQQTGMAHCWINQDAKLSLGLFEAGYQVEYEFNPDNKCLFVYVISGEIVIGNEHLYDRDGMGIWETGAIEIEVKKDAEFLVIETPVNP